MIRRHDFATNSKGPEVALMIFSVVTMVAIALSSFFCAEVNHPDLKDGAC